MEKNVILNNGVKMPVIGLGTYNDEDLNKLEISIKQSIEMGYRHIDTASFYGNEDVVGKAIKKLNTDYTSSKSNRISSKIYSR